MQRRFLLLVGAFVIALVLTGCDKCGNYEPINTPSIPKSCHTGPAPE